MMTDQPYIVFLKWSALRYNRDKTTRGDGALISYAVIGKHIKAARMRLGLTQAEAAERAGISATYYGKIERGIMTPNLDRLSGVSQALNLPLESMFQGAFIPDGELLDNVAEIAEEYEAFMHEVGKKVDDRTKIIIMRICGELSNLELPGGKNR